MRLLYKKSYANFYRIYYIDGYRIYSTVALLTSMFIRVTSDFISWPGASAAVERFEIKNRSNNGEKGRDDGREIKGN